MRLKELVLENFKIYYGKQVLNLEIPKEHHSPYRKNLILVGGLNGAGKTTILNAIYFALFGRQGMSEQEYKQTFTSAINDRYFEEGGRDCSVSLTFEDEKETVTITVTWSFDQEKKLVNDKEIRKIYVLDHITKQSREVQMTEQEYFDFINRRIPFEVAPFFIFDGEKIQNLVEKQDKQSMKESIQRIISLDAYKALIKDLEQIQASLERKLSSRTKERKVNEIITEIEAHLNELDESQDKLRNFNADIKKLEEVKQKIAIERRRKLAQNMESKQQIGKDIAETETRLKLLNDKLAKFAREDLANILLSPMIRKLQHTLQEEKKYLELKEQNKIKFQPYETFIDRLLSMPIQPELTEQQKEQIRAKGKEIWSELNRIREIPLEERTILHDISPGFRNKILSINTSFRNELKEILNEKTKLETLLNELNKKLENAPDPIDTSEEDKKLEEINKKLGELTTRAKQYKIKIRNLNDKITNLRNEYSRLEKSIQENSELDKQYRLVKQIRDAAAEFVEEMTRLKAAKIKYEFKSILDRLIRKDQEFEDVEFNEHDFVIRIYNDRGAEIRLADRSAGEKQIIALSFIWALTKTAGYSLPFVIDTPLGRLDSVHRKHLIQHYFNALSEQVIILSTDTEVNQEYIDFIQDYVVRQYHLVYDADTKSTRVEEGYFAFQ